MKAEEDKDRQQPAQARNSDPTLTVGGGLFFLLGHLFLVWYDHYWLALLPLICFMILGAFFRPAWILYLIAIATPLSLNFEELGIGLGLGIALPTEPLMAGLTLLFLYKAFLEGFPDPRILRHPMSVLLLIYLGWTLITTFTSTMPLVSLKHFLAQSWFVVSFFFLPLLLFRNKNWLFGFPWAYTLPLLVVVIYTLIWHGVHSFAEEPAYFMMNPFYKDHTSYGAALALVFPFVLERLFTAKIPLHYRVAFFLLVAIFALGIVFSYTRATWVSLVGALIVGLFLLFRLRFWVFAGTMAILALSFYLYQDRIFMQLEENQQDSSGDLAEHVESISNVASDASNLERINRWKSAWRMFQDKPLTGFGPGTYQFQYAPYQDPMEKTIISTNFGTRGTAHSEYLGPLSESGAPGFLIRSGIVVYLFYMGFRLFRQLPKGRTRGLAVGLFLGLVTYFTHGFLNNFLTKDKLAVPVWGFIAIMVAIDLHRRGVLGEKEKEEGSSDPESE